jgi:CO/xanthine dehydrogenase FAD-binding subunit
MLKLKGIEEVYYPQSIKEAVELLRAHGDLSAVVGGGLDISVFPNPRLKYLIFLDNLNLKYIKDSSEGIKVGAMSSVTDLVESDLIKNYMNGNVEKTLSEIATELLRNQITVGGSLGKREPYSDIVTLLYGLNAKIVLSDGEWDEVIAINDFYKENFRNLIKNRIIKEVILEKYDNNYFFSMKRHVRNATDIALFNMAILLKIDDGIVSLAHVAAGSRPKPAYFITEAEDYLKGKELSEDLAEDFGTFVETHIDVGTDTRTTEEYRKNLSHVFAKRILLEAMEALK